MGERTVVVTGANRGLGLELARQLAARGDKVIATVRRSEVSPLVGLRVRSEILDVTDPRSVARFAERIGNVPVDVLINNAGRGGPGPAFADLNWDLVTPLFAVNSIGPMRVTQALLPHLRKGGAKTVVSVSSRMGSVGLNAEGGAYAYRASKAALNMLNKSLALDLASEGFTCVVVHPGWVRTEMGGPEAPVTPHDSVAGLLDVIDGLTTADNGRFLDYQGEELAW